MDNSPLVSIIIACHNCEKYLDKYLESIINQTYQNTEIIICDDASTDNSISIIKAYERKDSRFVVLQNPVSIKAGATRNRCIDKATGEFIVIQDADDYSELNRVERLLAAITNNKDIDFVSSSAYLFSNDEEKYDAILKVKHRTPTKWNFLWSISFVHAATMFRTDCVKAVSGYRVSKETTRGQDYDLFMRLYAAGFRGININEPLYWVRADNSFFMRRVQSSPHDEYLIRKHGFEILNLMPIGYLFCLKPYFAELYHIIKNYTRK